jgi:diacylglycerol kinase family enzyme
MTIRKGRAWAENGPLAAGAPVVDSDAELRAIVERARRDGREPGEVGLLGGDLCRTLGGLGRPDRLGTAEAVRAPVDIVRAELDGRLHWFCAHLVAHRWCWVGEAVVAMNAEWLGDRKLGPRAHPNDGLVDVTTGSLAWQERLAARSRARTGTHVPHPRLRTPRSSHVDIELPRATPVWLDGVPAGRVRRVVLDVEPDALVVVV